MKQCAWVWTVTLQLNVTPDRVRVPKQNVMQAQHENVCHICREGGNGRRCQVIWPSSTGSEGEVEHTHTRAQELQLKSQFYQHGNTVKDAIVFLFAGLWSGNKTTFNASYFFIFFWVCVCVFFFLFLVLLLVVRLRNVRIYNNDAFTSWPRANSECFDGPTWFPSFSSTQSSLLPPTAAGVTNKPSIRRRGLRRIRPVGSGLKHLSTWLRVVSTDLSATPLIPRDRFNRALSVLQLQGETSSKTLLL